MLDFTRGTLKYNNGWVQTQLWVFSQNSPHSSKIQLELRNTSLDCIVSEEKISIFLLEMYLFERSVSMKIGSPVFLLLVGILQSKLKFNDSCPPSCMRLQISLHCLHCPHCPHSSWGVAINTQVYSEEGCRGGMHLNLSSQQAFWEWQLFPWGRGRHRVCPREEDVVFSLGMGSGPIRESPRWLRF